MNKIFFFLIMIKSFYAMEEDRISSQRVANFLQNDMGKKTKVYFNAEAKKTNNKNKNTLDINIFTNQPDLFFLYGKKLDLLLTRIKEKKYESILEEAQRENQKNKIIIETEELWNKRGKKNQKKFSFIAIETTEEHNNIFNYQIFLNALNNAIRADNEDIKIPLFTCKISNNSNDKAYQEEYEKIPDNLKKLVRINAEDFGPFIEIFQKNDNQEYYAIEKQKYIQKEKETQEEKEKEIKDFINKKREEYMNDKRNLIIAIIKEIIEEQFLRQVREKFKNKNNTIKLKYDLSFINNKNIKIGEYTKKYLTEKNSNSTIDIFNFIKSLITQLIYDSENSDTIEPIQKDYNIPPYIALLPSKLFMVQFEFFTIDNKTNKEIPLADDYSYSRDEIEELTKMQKIEYKKLYPYIEKILEKKIRIIESKKLEYAINHIITRKVEKINEKLLLPNGYEIKFSNEYNFGKTLKIGEETQKVINQKFIKIHPLTKKPKTVTIYDSIIKIIFSLIEDPNNDLKYKDIERDGITYASIDHIFICVPKIKQPGSDKFTTMIPWESPEAQEICKKLKSLGTEITDFSPVLQTLSEEDEQELLDALN